MLVKDDQTSSGLIQYQDAILKKWDFLYWLDNIFILNQGPGEKEYKHMTTVEHFPPLFSL